MLFLNKVEKLLNWFRVSPVFPISQIFRVSIKFSFSFSNEFAKQCFGGEIFYLFLLLISIGKLSQKYFSRFLFSYMCPFPSGRKTQECSKKEEVCGGWKSIKSPIHCWYPKQRLSIIFTAISKFCHFPWPLWKCLSFFSWAKENGAQKRFDFTCELWFFYTWLDFLTSNAR